MAVDPLSNPTMQAVQRALSALSARQQVISNNVANVETPRYTAREVRFEDALRGAMLPASGPGMLVSHAQHIRDVPPGLSTVRPNVVLSAAPGRNDGNNVEMEREMAALAETQITFQALAQIMSKRIDGIRSVLSDTR